MIVTGLRCGVFKSSLHHRFSIFCRFFFLLNQVCAPKKPILLSVVGPNVAISSETW